MSVTPSQDAASSKLLKVAARQIRRWREDPVFFVRTELKFEPDEWQAEVLRAAARQDVKGVRIALAACKGPGKSTVLACLVLWCLACFPHPKVVCTSISGDNLRDGLWTELAKWMRNSAFLQRAFEWNAERIVSKHHPETWWASARQWSKSADPSQQANTLAGIHARFVMFILDEAGGIPDGVAAAAEAGLANADAEPGNRAWLFLAGNPTHLSGPLWRAFNVERHLYQLAMHITGDPDDPKRAPRVSIQWAREQIEKYGREHPYVLVNVFGLFPPAQSNALIGLDEAMAASKRSLPEAAWTYEPKVLGVDVARFGDDRSVIFPRQGRAAFVPRVFRNIDTMELAGQVVMAIERWKPDGIFVDVDGVGGGVVDRLNQLGYPAVGIHSAGKPVRPSPRLANRRADMWWAMADWLRGGGCIPDDAELVKELAGPTYRFDKSGAVILEAKEEMKKRGLASPDIADALALTFALPVMAKADATRLIPGLPFGEDVGRSVTDYDPFESGRL